MTIDYKLLTMSSHECVLILDNIRSAYNTGSMFRTADAAGVSSIVLTGYTPAPIEKSRERPDIAKVALGAEKSVPWKVVPTVTEAIEELKNLGYAICILERDAKAMSLFEYKPTTKFALVVGNEVEGVPPEVIQMADAILEIPMNGMKESLNVSVAAGVALYQLLQARSSH